MATKQADTAVCQPSFVKVAVIFAQTFRWRLSSLNNNTGREKRWSLYAHADTMAEEEEEEEEDGR